MLGVNRRPWSGVWRNGDEWEKGRGVLAGEREFLTILQHSEVESLLQHQTKTKRSNDKNTFGTPSRTLCGEPVTQKGNLLEPADREH